MKFLEFFSKMCPGMLLIVIVSAFLFIACEQKKNSIGSTDNDHRLPDTNNKIQIIGSQAGNEM